MQRGRDGTDGATKQPSPTPWSNEVLSLDYAHLRYPEACHALFKRYDTLRHCHGRCFSSENSMNNFPMREPQIFGALAVIVSLVDGQYGVVPP